MSPGMAKAAARVMSIAPGRRCAGCRALDQADARVTERRERGGSAPRRSRAWCNPRPRPRSPSGCPALRRVASPLDHGHGRGPRSGHPHAGRGGKKGGQHRGGCAPGSGVAAAGGVAVLKTSITCPGACFQPVNAGHQRGKETMTATSVNGARGAAAPSNSTISGGGGDDGNRARAIASGIAVPATAGARMNRTASPAPAAAPRDSRAAGTRAVSASAAASVAARGGGRSGASVSAWATSPGPFAKKGLRVEKRDPPPPPQDHDPASVTARHRISWRPKLASPPPVRGRREEDGRRGPSAPGAPAPRWRHRPRRIRAGGARSPAPMYISTSRRAHRPDGQHTHAALGAGELAHHPPRRPRGRRFWSPAKR